MDAYIKANAASSPDHIATETVLKLLGLEVCADTIVGDQLLRGISGGQKKRVTSGIISPTMPLPAPAQRMVRDAHCAARNTAVAAAFWLHCSC